MNPDETKRTRGIVTHQVIKGGHQQVRSKPRWRARINVAPKDERITKMSQKEHDEITASLPTPSEILRKQHAPRGFAA